MALTWRFASPDGDGDGLTPGSPWTWNSEAMQDGLTPGMIVGLVPAHGYTGLPGLVVPSTFGATTSATPLVLCGVDASGNPFDPTRSVDGTGPLVASTLRTIGLDAGQPLVVEPPNYLWLFALRVIGNRKGYIIDPGSDSENYADSFMIDSCDVENQNEDVTGSPPTGGIHLGSHSALSNSDVLIQAGAEACVKDQQSSLITICRLRGGRVGIQNQAKNTAILNTVLREHTEAGILYNGIAAGNSAIPAARIHIASVTGHDLGDFLRILGDPPAEGIGYILDGHITECSGFLVRCMGTNPSTVIVRNTRRRAVTLGDADNVVGTELWTLHTHDDSTGDAQDYQGADAGDFRLVPTAIGRNKSLLSGNELGAFLNMAYF